MSLSGKNMLAATGDQEPLIAYDQNSGLVIDVTSVYNATELGASGVTGRIVGVDHIRKILVSVDGADVYSYDIDDPTSPSLVNSITATFSGVNSYMSYMDTENGLFYLVRDEQGRRFSFNASKEISEDSYSWSQYRGQIVSSSSGIYYASNGNNDFIYFKDIAGAFTRYQTPSPSLYTITGVIGYDEDNSILFCIIDDVLSALDVSDADASNWTVVWSEATADTISAAYDNVNKILYGYTSTSNHPIYDVSTPSSPSLISDTSRLEGGIYTISTKRDVIFAHDFGTGLYDVFDMQDPSSPVLLDTFTLSSFTGSTNNRLYLSYAENLNAG
jgi:hypothetical protein